MPKIGTLQKFTLDGTEYDSLQEVLRDSIAEIVNKEINDSALAEVSVDTIDAIIKNLKDLKKQCLKLN